MTLVCKVRCTGVPGQPPPSFHPQQDLRIRIAHSTTLRVVSPSLLCAILTFFTSTLHPPFIIIDNYHLAMDHFTALSARSLEARQTRRCYTTLSGRVRCRYTTSRWHNWGRWLAVALIIAAFLVGVLAFWLVLSLIAVDALRKSLMSTSCITAARRRKAGRKPIAGTGWVPNRMFYQTSQAPPPQYGAPAPHAAESNAGYYGKEYQPPAGPPPAQNYQPPAGPPPVHTQ